MALPETAEARREVWFAMKRFLQAQEDERRRLLGLWVSELESEFVYSRLYGWELAGITVRGWDKIVIYANGYSDHRFDREKWPMFGVDLGKQPAETHLYLQDWNGIVGERASETVLRVANYYRDVKRTDR